MISTTIIMSLERTPNKNYLYFFHILGMKKGLPVTKTEKNYPFQWRSLQRWKTIQNTSYRKTSEDTKRTLVDMSMTIEQWQRRLINHSPQDLSNTRLIQHNWSRQFIRDLIPYESLYEEPQKIFGHLKTIKEGHISGNEANEILEEAFESEI